jgi:hypothetical protein
VRLADDELGLRARLFLEFDRRLLGREQRLSEQALELPVPAELVLEVVDSVAQVLPLAPNVLVALGDLFEQVVDRAAPEAADERVLQFDVPDLYGCDSHSFISFSAAGRAGSPRAGR